MTSIIIEDNEIMSSIGVIDKRVFFSSLMLITEAMTAEDTIMDMSVDAIIASIYESNELTEDMVNMYPNRYMNDIQKAENPINPEISSFHRDLRVK